MAKYLFTSESVTEGHPDKICDQISDAVLDAIIAKDPQARVACETAVTTGMVLIMGEISTNCYVDIPAVARDVIRGIGYDRAKFGFDYATCAVLTSIDEQSGDIALGVDEALEQKQGAGDEADSTGAGDQMSLFYACLQWESNPSGQVLLLYDAGLDERAARDCEELARGAGARFVRSPEELAELLR